MALYYIKDTLSRNNIVDSTTNLHYHILPNKRQNKMSKQTAVDYLVEQLFKTRNNTTEVKEMDINSIIEQAKQMEKEHKCYHPLSERKHTSDFHFECTICGGNNY
jgi:hypothetical protein